MSDPRPADGPDEPGPADEADLAGLLVVDFSTQIAGPYCTKLLLDAGAEVIKVEPPGGGDPMRSWSATGADLGGRDGPLFTFLNAGKRSVVGTSTDDAVAALLDRADLVVEAHGLDGDAGERLDVAAVRAGRPWLVVLSVTPYGRTGPWAGRGASEFTLQAECGSIGIRGVPGGVPYQAGGRIAEWAAGAYGAVATLAAVTGARRHGRGEHVDLSILETANLVFSNFSDTTNRLMNGGPGDPELAFLVPSVETPSIEPTADGYVGFCTNARQQFNDFLVLIDRADLLADDEIGTVAGRSKRFAEWTAIVHGWCAGRTTAEIIEQASLLRIPVSDVGNGETVLVHEQLVARGVYGPDAERRCRRPRRPYLLDGAEPPPPRPAPALGSFGAGQGVVPPSRGDVPGRAAPAPAEAASGLPLEGVKVLDLTAWWAGPACAQVFATFGADVVHVESPSRADGMRMTGGAMARHFPSWWEASPHFLHANANKRGITLDLTAARGREVLEQLVAWCDVVIENFTPRAFDNFGFSWEWVGALNPKAVLVRMPAFGLTGPWRDRPGFAQNIEQLSGLAWVTGHADDQPRVPRGPCDPIAGVHAAVALFAALARRDRSGRGHHVEAPLCEVALNIAAEQVLEFSAFGRRMEREGNRSPLAAPQGLYPCADEGSPTARWLALSVGSDAQWRALVGAMGHPAWAVDPSLASLAGRRAAHDLVDAHLASWTEARPRAELVAELRQLGITASEVADPSRLVQTNPQLAHRKFFERPDHPVVGPVPLPSQPFRFDGVDRWLRRPAPTVGQHNRDVLGGILGLSPAELDRLEADGIIGTGLGGRSGST